MELRKVRGLEESEGSASYVGKAGHWKVINKFIHRKAARELDRQVHV